MGWVDRILTRVTWTLAAFGGLALATIALIILLDVTLRYFASPLIGGLEVVRVVFVASCFFAFAYTSLIGREIRIDAIRPMLPPRLGAAADIMASTLTLTFFACLVWFGCIHWWKAWVRDIYLEGRLLIPMTIPWGAIVLGSALSVIVSARSLCISAATLVTGREPAAAGGEPQDKVTHEPD